MSAFRASSRESLIPRMRAMAARGIYNGAPTPANQAFLARCTWRFEPASVTLIFSRDSGMHSSGWWKNPDYERCLHLSVSFSYRSPIIGAPEQLLPQDRKEAARWCELLFGEHRRWLWVESPFSKGGKARDVWHYRLFCDPSWAPILPRGEVYTREFTEAGWQSWSDLHAFDNGDGDFGAPLAAAQQGEG